MTLMARSIAGLPATTKDAGSTTKGRGLSFRLWLKTWPLFAACLSEVFAQAPVRRDVAPEAMCRACSIELGQPHLVLGDWRQRRDRW